MKVIFVASGNKRVGTVSSFVQSQYDSLKAEGLDMVLFPIVGHGMKGYLKAVFALRKIVKQERPDIIHAHYSTCGFVASLACLCMRHKPKIVVSILGSFPTKGAKWYLVRFAIKCLWHQTIVKSKRTMNQLGIELPVIPNGVNLDIFHPMDLVEARKMVGFKRISELESEKVNEKKYVIWCSNPSRPEKNYALAQEAIKRVNESFELERDKNSEELIVNSVELIPVFDKTPDEVCTYMNAADCLLLTSDSEGSPNVIKEAMACNCPIVTTNVGDVEERLHDLEGCFVVSNKELENERVRELGKALEKALAFGKRTDGRNRILNDKLEISQIAKRIIEVYEQV